MAGDALSVIARTESTLYSNNKTFSRFEHADHDKRNIDSHITLSNVCSRNPP